MPWMHYYRTSSSDRLSAISCDFQRVHRSEHTKPLRRGLCDFLHQGEKPEQATTTGFKLFFGYVYARQLGHDMSGHEHKKKSFRLLFSHCACIRKSISPFYYDDLLMICMYDCISMYLHIPYIYIYYEVYLTHKMHWLLCYLVFVPNLPLAVSTFLGGS